VKTATGRWLGLALLVSSIVLSAVGQLCMKAGMKELHAAGSWWVDGFAPIVWTVAGLTAYVCSLFAWLAVLVRYPLSFAYPVLSLSYILVYLGATNWPLLAETATPMRTAGTLLILAGVALVSVDVRAEGDSHGAD
jgi:undecaprenyl phosphate-alpha-L-ara4N flippase subunit ArnF